MARTESNIMARGTIAPDFKLVDTVSNKEMSLQEFKGEQGTVVLFICNHCPYVLHVNDELVSIAKEYANKGIGFIAISSNDAAQYPQDAPDKMKEQAEAVGYPFPYLYDATQEVAKAYNAACTPDIFAFDKDLKLAYHGQLDDSRPSNGVPVSGKDLRAALDDIIRGEEPSLIAKPSMGCNIKWRK